MTNMKPIMDQVRAELADHTGKGIMTGDPVVSLANAEKISWRAAHAAAAVERYRADRHPTPEFIATLAATLLGSMESWSPGDVKTAVKYALLTWEEAEEATREATESYQARGLALRWKGDKDEQE